MPQIETLPSKLATGALLVPLAKKLLLSPKMSDSHDLLTQITFSGKLSSSDRRVIIQTAVHRFAQIGNVEQLAVGKWLTLCSSDHAEEFKESVAPLVDILEAEKMKELESLTNLTLNVFSK